MHTLLAHDGDQGGADPLASKPLGLLACLPDVEDLETAVELTGGMKDQALRWVGRWSRSRRSRSRRRYMAKWAVLPPVRRRTSCQTFRYLRVIGFTGAETGKQELDTRAVGVVCADGRGNRLPAAIAPPGWGESAGDLAVAAETASPSANPVGADVQ